MKRFTLLILSAALALMTGCTTDEAATGPGTDGGTEDQKVTFRLRIPGGQTPSGTRAANVDDTVSAVDILLFDASGTFAGHGYGTGISVSQENSDPAKATFTVLLTPGTYSVVVVANARDRINTLLGTDRRGLDGESKADILAALTYTFSSATGWNIASRPIPMYGETASAVTIQSGMSEVPLTLRRMASRIDVKVSTADFTLGKIHLVNYNTAGYIAPKWDASGSIVSPAPTTPWLPAAPGAQTGTDNAIAYNVGGATTYENLIYTFEAAAASEATLATAPCLIFEGTYGGDTYFYRADFTYAGDPTDPAFDPAAVAYMPLLRNHKYVVEIASATGPGYTSIEEAFASSSVRSNLKIYVSYYDESVLTSVVYDGQYMLGVASEDVTLRWDGAPQDILVVTNYDYDYDDPLQENGWRITGYSATKDGAVSSTAPAWLVAAKETADAAKCNLTLHATDINVAVTDINGYIDLASGDARTVYVHLQAGRLRHVVKVTQARGSGLFDMVDDSPNCYMVSPGSYVKIPALKAWLAWKSPDLAEPIDPALPVTAELVWQDAQNLIEEVRLVDGDRGADSEIVVRARSGKQGNAVVAVKVGGEIKWSWHVWVIANEPNSAGVIKGYTFMNYNLGALDNIPGSELSGGLHYQWGRKDPFVGSRYNNLSNQNMKRDIYDAYNNIIDNYPALPEAYQSILEDTSSDPNTVNKSILNPDCFMIPAASSDNLDWLAVGKHANYLWGSPTTDKSVYDPCPWGWKVPPKEAFDNSFTVSNSPWNATYRGRDFNVLGWMPASGGISKGNHILGGEWGFIWSATYWTDQTAQRINFSKDAILINKQVPLTSSDKYGGLSVRCVRDDSAATPPPGTGTTPAGFLPYVGAFWRADQTGERLIRIGHVAGAEGEWTARVVHGTDWVKLDTKPTADPGVTFNASTENPADMTAADKLYQVDGSVATVVKGNLSAGGSIYFRIGLTSELPGGATAAPRYGVVLLSYANNTIHHKIYLRQGEAADYLMRPGDPNGSGTAVANNRSYARKFSPYNLTVPSWTSTGTPVGVRGGVPVDYPTQGGAFFQLKPTNGKVYAYNPSIPYNSAPDNWQSGAATGYWSTVIGWAETCPPGYRRPTDGVTNTANTAGGIASSEIRQSLWLSPGAGIAFLVDNSVAGYYADGFFDRRTPETPAGTNGSIGSAVKVGYADAAYKGRLFYNPYNSASLFIPTPGGRYNSGVVMYPGSNGWYWTSSMYSTSNGWALTINDQTTSVYYHSTVAAFSIRCVAE